MAGNSEAPRQRKPPDTSWIKTGPAANSGRRSDYCQCTWSCCYRHTHATGDEPDPVTRHWLTVIVTSGVVGFVFYLALIAALIAATIYFTTH